MNNEQAMIEALESRAKRREERRAFFRTSGNAAIAVAGAARVYLGVHWMTDVVAGWLLGGAWVAFTAAVLLMLTRPRGPRSVEVRGARPGPAPEQRPAAVEHLRAPRPRPAATDDDRTGRLPS